MSKLRCKLFGHKISGSNYSHPPYYTRYLSAKRGPVDNLKTHHARIIAECDRCEEEFFIGHIHVNKEDKLGFKKK